MELALFPLHTVLFPGGQLPLHIFETRYRAMMEHVLANDRTFGVVAIAHGMEAGGAAEIHPIGTTATIQQIKRRQDGSMDITVAGALRFRVERRLPDDPFPRALIEPLEEIPGDDAAALLTPARAALHRYLSVVARLQGTDVHAPAMPADIVDASFAIAAALEVDLPERQRLLACETAAARLQLAIDLARREAALLDAVGPSVGRPEGIYSPN